MTANTRYLAGLWVAAGLMAVLVAIQLGLSLAAGRIWLAVLPIVVAVAVLLVIRWRVGDRRVRQLLQAGSAEPLVAFSRRMIRPGRLPNGDALLAQASAVAYILYADYPSARAALTGVAWGRCPPFIRAAHTAAEALLCYFETGEYVQGLNLAVSAQELAAVPTSFPGARAAAAAYESYVQIGQVLCGRSTDATVASLEQKMAVLPTIGRLLVAWGLAVAHRQRGDAARAEAMLAQIREVAPHCRALALPLRPVQAEPASPPERAT